MMGAETIGEISSEKLWAALLRSHRRKVMLGLLVRITGGEASPAELRQHVTENLSLAAHPAAAE
jgi:hypothetical protein